jgi:Zn-dependent protease
VFGGGKNMRLFKAFGIQVSVDWSWLIALGYVMFVMVEDYQSLLGPEQRDLAFVYGVVVAFAFFGSIVLHEFGHAVVARRNGIGILGIDLWMLGGLAKMDREPQSAGVEFRVAAAGPFVTLLLSLGFLGAAFGLHDGPNSQLEPLTWVEGGSPLIFALTTLGWINVFLLFFNLIPAYPLDGGRIARAAVWAATGDQRRATLAAASVGRWFGYLLVAFGVWMLLRGAYFGGALFMFMGWTLSQTARAASFQENILGDARGLTVSDVMDPQPVTVPGELSAARTQDEFFWRYNWPWFPVVGPGGEFLGLIEQDALDRLDENELASRTAADLIAAGNVGDISVDGATPLTSVVANEHLRMGGALMVTREDGQLAGVITIEQVQRALREAIARATQQSMPRQNP